MVGSQEWGPSAEVKTTVVYPQGERAYGGDIITAREATGSRQKRRDILQFPLSELSLVFPIGQNCWEARGQGMLGKAVLRAEQRRGRAQNGSETRWAVGQLRAKGCWEH